MTRWQITIRTSLSAFKEMGFVFLWGEKKKKKGELWTVKGCGTKTRVIEKCKEGENWRRRLEIRYKRWEVIASIIRKKRKMDGGGRRGRRGKRASIIKSCCPALKVTCEVYAAVHIQASATCVLFLIKFKLRIRSNCCGFLTGSSLFRRRSCQSSRFPPRIPQTRSSLLLTEGQKGVVGGAWGWLICTSFIGLVSLIPACVSV